jgi:PPOX class probable F420-dependent enzyme
MSSVSRIPKTRSVPELSATARALLDEPNIAVLATLMEDGGPQTSAVWVSRSDEDVLIATTDNMKLRNMRRDPAVSFTVIDRNDPYLELNCRGTVVAIDEGAGVPLIDALSQQYYGKSPYPYHKQGEQWYAVRIVLDRWRTNRD